MVCSQPCLLQLGAGSCMSLDVGSIHWEEGQIECQDICGVCLNPSSCIEVANAIL